MPLPLFMILAITFSLGGILVSVHFHFDRRENKWLLFSSFFTTTLFPISLIIVWLLLHFNAPLIVKKEEFPVRVSQKDNRTQCYISTENGDIPEHSLRLLGQLKEGDIVIHTRQQQNAYGLYLLPESFYQIKE